MADALTTEHAYASLKFSAHFDYTEVKNRYMEQVRMYYSNRKLPVVTPYTREVVDRIKKLIKEMQVLIAAGHPSEHSKYRVAKRYEVYEQNGEEILICKRLLPDDPVVQVVPAEDCFDILVDAHLQTKHGTKERMLSVIKRGNYVVPKTSIDFLLVVCKMCNLNGKTKRRADERIPHVFHARGQVSLIDMTDSPDNQFKHILCYIDRFTRFMLLRPLMTDSVQETAMELLKIFFDFGPPEKLETYNRPFFLQVISLINTAHNDFNISLVLPVQMPVITPFNVRDMLCKWQNKTGCSNWAMGCYKVQWNNNSEVNFNRPSPYAGVFKRCSVGTDKHQRTEKPLEDELNTLSTVSPHHLNRDDNSCSNSSTAINCADEDVTLIAHEECEVSEDDDDDCLISFTEVPSESAPTIITLPNEESRKRPKILRKILLNDKPINPKPTGVLGNTKNNNNTLKEVNQVEGKDLTKPTNKKCHVCKTEINKAYTCTKCNRNVHLFCSDRLLQPNIPADVLTVTCTSCTLTNTQYENKKRKVGDIDGNKTKTTPKREKSWKETA